MLPYEWGCSTCLAGIGCRTWCTGMEWCYFKGGHDQCREDVLDARAEIERLRGLIDTLLASAVPHPVHNPTMWRAWRKTEEALGIPENKSHTIGTSDKKLEAALLGPDFPKGIY